MIHLAMLIGTVAILIALSVTVVMARHERRQRETWRDDEPYEGRHVLDDE